LHTVGAVAVCERGGGSGSVGGVAGEEQAFQRRHPDDVFHAGIIRFGAVEHRVDEALHRGSDFPPHHCARDERTATGNRRASGLLVSYLAGGMSAIAVFAVFLFLTYYLQLVKGSSPIIAGVSFPPLTAGIVTASTSANVVLLPRTGTAPAGGHRDEFGAIGMSLLARPIPPDRAPPQKCCPRCSSWDWVSA